MKNKVKPFTLIELLIALGLFSVMIVIMMDFFGQCQRAWRTSESSIRVFENARTIFDVIEQDFFHACASTDFEREIPFAIVGDGAYGPFPCMVSRVADTQASNSRLAEVTYEIGKTDVNGRTIEDIEGKSVDGFRRAVTTDRTMLGNGINPEWDFFGQPEGLGADWASTHNSFQGIASGILEMRMHYRSLDPAPSDYESAASLEEVHVPYLVLRRGMTYHFLPRIVDIELTLFDYKTEAASNPLKTKRTFYKRIFVGQGPKNY